MKQGTIITIGRQCGSGGHEIGRKLAERLGIPCYDKELLHLAAEHCGLTKEDMELYDEAPTNSLLYSLSLGNHSMGMAMGHFELPPHQRVFLAQFNAIQKLADEGESCVIVGRCADYALAEREQVIHVFLRSDIRGRVQRMITLHDDLNEKKAADQIVKTDRKRANYHNYYADTKWGSSESYDLVLDSLQLGIDKTVDLLASYVNLRFPD
ncbi:MAG: cytidylate kinase-like family protein [Clostridia bacterium]|nr:cytidylate kinase-like family protein [Clostridia bacterium]